MAQVRTESTTHKVGLDSYSLTGQGGTDLCERDVFSMLRTVKELGADGLQCFVPDEADEINRAFDFAAEQGLYLEPYARLPLHWRNDADEIERRERKFHLLCRIASERGVKALHCTMGARERFEDYPRWRVHVEATALADASGARDARVRRAAGY